MTAGAATIDSGALLVVSIMLPVTGMLAVIVSPARRSEQVALVILAASLLTAVATAAEVLRTGAPIEYLLGNWRPPLGVTLRADGLSVTLMVMASIVLSCVGLYASGSYLAPPDAHHSRSRTVFWTLLLGLSAALNTAFLAQDLFTLFVALELLTFSAVALVALDGRPTSLEAALRYLLLALAGSVFYLVGTAVLYGAYGRLDLSGLRQISRDDLATTFALSLMMTGLLVKTALFPMHLWLPPAHAGAPAAASAVLSALVVKAPFFLIVLLWTGIAPRPFSVIAGQILAILGMASIVFCSVMALRQSRLKLMIAYSTVAQVGYLFLVFPLAIGGIANLAWSGCVLQLVSHAFAKASMFLAAGVIAEAVGHDRISNLKGTFQAVPITLAAFALAGLSLIGLPISGGFSAKYMLLTAATEIGAWWIAGTILVGGLLAAGYVFKVLGHALAPPAEGFAAARSIPLHRELVVLVLASAALALGVLPLDPLTFITIGRTGLP
jgi:multicomponent Na+:H+ antiporter subunit D